MGLGAVAAIGMVGGAIFKGVSAYAEGQAQQEAADEQAALAQIQGKIGKIQSEVNAALIGDQIRDVQHVAAGQVSIRRGIAQRQVGSQRASAAAQGVDVAGGSVQEALAETTLLGELDAVTIQNNAARQVFGLRTARENAKFAGEMSEILGLGTAEQLQRAGSAAATRGAIGFGVSLGEAGLSLAGSYLAKSMRPSFSRDNDPLF